MKKLFFAATVVAVTLATQGADDMSARLDALLATSNQWGTTVAEYDVRLAQEFLHTTGHFCGTEDPVKTSLKWMLNTCCEGDANTSLARLGAKTS